MAKIADKAMDSTEALRSVCRLATEKHFELLVVSLDFLLLDLSGDVLYFREYLGQRRRVQGGFVGSHCVRCHSDIVESGMKKQ